MSWVGRSSVEVVVWLEQKIQDRWRKLTRALFLMACRNATNTAAAIVNPLQPANDEEKRIYTGGESKGDFKCFERMLEFFINTFHLRSKTTTNPTSKGIDFQSGTKCIRAKNYSQYVYENNGSE